ncbi:ABC transporter substrate-binding protein [Variovorax sp. J22R115]|uniref:ABC transporter substrate-binding protein n=1 Tax=Variovorax sp. J22R115 TaxID=3053509 RepID=UPI0025776ABE|nr:ABC transporter substrate-binding protein [Variovorax sp. J22R115]MDM0049802.1 ABC transporter substrate-binding protein [Variovorax sp. J22R115]
MLSFEDSAESIPILNEFMAELARRGYREDVNLKIVRRNAALDGRNFDRMALDLVEQRPDLIVTTAGTASVQAAKRATSTIPIVMLSSVEPVRDGLVSSLARPGGNLTGNSLNGIELLVKRLQLIADIVRPKRIGYLGIQRSAFMRHFDEYMAAIASAAQAHGAELQTFIPNSLDELPAVFADMKRREVQALLIDNPAVFYMNASRIARMVVGERIPAIAEGRAWATSGVLITYGIDYLDLARKAVAYVDRIAKGAKPQDLPVEQATRFELVINMKTANALGVEIPQRILLLANEVLR